MKLILLENNIEVSEIAIADEDLLNGNSLFLGRDKDCHIILDDIQISRHHAKMYVEENSLLVESLSSSGLVQVDGLSVRKGLLDSESVIGIGRFTLKLAEHNSLFDKMTLEKMSVSPEIAAPASEGEDLTKTEFMPTEDSSLPEEVESEELENTIDEVEAVEDDISEEPEGEDQVEDDFLNDEFNTTDETQVEDIEEEAPAEEFEQEDSFENDSFEDDAFGDDGGFGDDAGFGSEDSGDSTKLFSGFANYTLSIFGEYAPIDKFNVTENEVFIGRDDEKCQIVLSDPEVSTVHAVIKKTALNLVLEDLNSSNGTLMNGERINKKVHETGDEFLIGTTSFTVEVRSDLIEAEKDRLMPVDENQEIEVEEVIEEEVDADEFAAEAEKDLSGKEKLAKIFQEKKKVIYIAGALILAIVLFGPEDKPEPKKAKVAKPKESQQKKQQENKPKTNLKLPPEVIEKLEQNYALTLAKFDEGAYYEAKEYLGQVIAVDPNYKDSQTLSKLIQEGVDKLIKLEKEEAAEKERRKRQLKIQALLEKAKKAVEDREVAVAESLFGQILKIDPENIDVPSLRIEIEAYQKEQERIKFEKERKIAERNAKVEKLKPGKALYLKGDWYNAINALENFLEIKDMDEDLIKEATKMLRESQQKLLRILNPLLSKARSYKEGQDLKQAFETYGEVLKYNPVEEEALEEREVILKELKMRSRKLYREGLIAESMSSYGQAKEKFQEVLQVSPVGSDYYIKAANKLDNYLE